MRQQSSLRSKRFRAVSRVKDRATKTTRKIGSRFISRAAKTENLVHRSFFAPKQHGNACYAGYQQSCCLFAVLLAVAVVVGFVVIQK